MNAVQFTTLSFAVDENRKSGALSSQFSALTTLITPEDIVNSGHLPKCGSCWLVRLLSKERNAESVRDDSLTAMTWCPTTYLPRASVQHGEMTTPTISRQHIGDATWKKDRRDCKVPARSMTERQSFAGRCTIMTPEPDDFVADVRHG